MRRLAARIVLSAGIVFELLLIAALPLFSMDSDAWRSFALLVALLLVSFRELSPTPAAPRSAQLISIFLAFGTFATVPAALAFAWPLRHVATSLDSRTDVICDS